MLKHFVSAQNFLTRQLRSDRGATAVEYGLLVALIAAVIVAIVVVVGHQVSNAFQTVSNSLQ
ncbi:MAG TPA: Flp family type IVb pilin [Streptosporangiaceae bacterium]|nr:Flp family type IVb pilin [Streptosporangiaceae bacterium]